MEESSSEDVARYQRSLKQRILRAELVEQCYYAHAAAYALQEALKRPPFPPDPRLPKRNADGSSPPPIRIVGDDPLIQYLIEWRVNILAPIQTILTSAAVVANLLWDDVPSNGCDSDEPVSDKAERRELIFEGMSIPELPNLKSKKARNALLHVEDHVLRWMKSQLVIDEKAKLGPLLVFEGPAASRPPDTHFRGLNKLTWDFWAKGNMCNLRLMVQEMDTITGLVPTHSRMDARPP